MSSDQLRPEIFRENTHYRLSSQTYIIAHKNTYTKCSTTLPHWPFYNITVSTTYASVTNM